MLNTWWKELDRKPFGTAPVRIRHLVETALAAGWSLNECYEALDVTWAFTESAFETTLRIAAEEGEALRSPHSNVTTIEETHKALELNKKESLSIDENVKRLQKLRQSKN
jgi:hypothetical protein